MLILIQLPGKLTYNKIGLTKVLKYNLADIVTGILPKNHFYGSYLGFCVLSNFFGTIQQTPIWQTRQSDKHKRKSGRQENPTNSGLRQSGKQDNLGGLVVPYLPVCRIFFHQCLSDCTVCRIFCMKIGQIDLNYTRHPSNTFSLAQILSYATDTIF